MHYRFHGSGNFYKERNLAPRERTYHFEHLLRKFPQHNNIFLNLKLTLLAVAKYFTMLSFNYLCLVVVSVHLVTAKVWLGKLPSNENEKEYS